jgi:hypothetical protein
MRSHLIVRAEDELKDNKMSITEGTNPRHPRGCETQSADAESSGDTGPAAHSGPQPGPTRSNHQ